MSDTDFQPGHPDDNDDDIIAAEYALGVLSAADQARLARRVETDPAFARRVSQWQERLSPMAEGVEPVALPASVKQALDLRLFGQPLTEQAQPSSGGFWSSLGFWRSVSGLATLALLLALVLPGMQTGERTGPPLTEVERLAASLRADGSNVTYLVLYDSATNSVSLAHLTGDPVIGRDFQLWIARGTEAPVSLGVIPAGVSTRVAVDEATRILMTTAAHMAISLEPPGGSPTGQPTGPVLAVGDLLKM